MGGYEKSTGQFELGARVLVTCRHDALHRVARLQRAANAKLLEDYQLLVAVQAGVDIFAVDEEKFVAILERTIKPQYEIAANMGFQKNWVYGKGA